MSGPLNPGSPCIVCGASPAWAMHGEPLCVDELERVAAELAALPPAQRKEGP